MHLTEKEALARTKVCLPLDGLETLEELKAMVEELSPVVGLFKIGKGSYTRFGPASVEAIQNYGANVFLDLKYHDIPNTVKDAASAATKLGVYIFNVHASGGVEMMQAAVEGTQNTSQKYNIPIPKIIGVTLLTSIDQKMLHEQLQVHSSVSDYVLHLAKQSQTARLDGIVCSAADLSAIKHQLPKQFMYITPGIQGPNTPAGSDQKRVFSPGNAIQEGSTILVIGRAITTQKNPDARLQAGYEILQDISKYL